MMERDGLAIDAAKLYFLSELSQQEVAAHLGLSRPTVSKLLQHAKDRGFVTISITDPRESDTMLRRELREAYNLTDVRLVTVPSDDPRDLLPLLGAAGADVVHDLVHDGDLIGVSWGETLYAVAQHLAPKNVTGVNIIQLKGGMSYSATHTNDVETMQLFCKAFDAFGRFLPLPVIFDSLEVKSLVEQETHLKMVMDLGREADTVIFTVGAVTPDALLFNLGHLSPAEKDYLQEHAVGDICSRFYDASGEICMPELDARTVGLSLNELRVKSRRVLVAGGAAKAKALETALRHGYATHLVTDHASADRLLAAARKDTSAPL